MNKIPFGKPPLTYLQQIEQLEKRGLLIEDRTKTARLLESISYYRMSGYWYPLLEDKAGHVFKKGAAFGDAFKLYCFDRKLRQLVLSELEKIEVAIRAKMIYVLSHRHGPFWFSDPSLFKNVARHAESVKKIREEYSRSDEEFIKSFRDRYSDPLPPSWISIEATSFGTLSMLFGNLSQRTERIAIASHFGLADAVFETWLHGMVYLRNVCAHHSRLWNRSMDIRPKFPKKTDRPWIGTQGVKNNKTYFMLAVIRYLSQAVDTRPSFPLKLKALLSHYGNVDVAAMNFPDNWEDEPLWRE